MRSGLLRLESLIADAEECLGWPYASPGSNDRRGIDCSGLLVWAYRRQGGRIAHGSNTIWRRYLGEKGELRPGDRLRRGMAVFRHRAADTDKYPDGEGDFYHVGLVTSEDPLRIVHASSARGRVVAEDSARGWTHWGYLRAVAYPLPAWAEKDCARTLRRGCRGDDVAALQLRLRGQGYELEADGIYGPVTRGCVRALQRLCGIREDGVAGPETFAALREREETGGGAPGKGGRR